MPYALTDDAVRLYYEEAGTGEPIIFVHEFAGSYWSWEPQIRYFSRRHRCLVYAARGYPPSDVPEEVERYGQARAAADIGAVMDAAGIERAHVVGLSMGAFATLHFGLDQPSRALSLVCAGIGYGAHKDHEAAFRRQAEEVARAFETQGSEQFAPIYGSAAARVQYEAKDPRGYAEFIQRLAKHSPRGAANTQVRFDTGRLHYDQVGLVSPFHFTPRDVRASYELLSSGDFGGDSLVAGEYPLEHLEEALARHRRGDGPKFAIVPTVA